MNGRQFEFKWDKAKAAGNQRKHRVSFELGSTVFDDPRLLTVADLGHSETEERWFSGRSPLLAGESMNDRPIDDDEMPAEIDFSKAVRGLHHIPAGTSLARPN